MATIAIQKRFRPAGERVGTYISTDEPTLQVLKRLMREENATLSLIVNELVREALAHRGIALPVPPDGRRGRRGARPGGSEDEGTTR